MPPDPRVYWVLEYQLRDDTDLTQDRYDESDWVKVVPVEALAQAQAAVWREAYILVRNHVVLPLYDDGSPAITGLRAALKALEQQARGEGG